MMGARRIWLVVNGASGSNDEGAIGRLRRCFAAAGLAIEQVTSFPDQPAPRLEESGMTTVALFAGDGTANAVIGSLEGWSGDVLVLPGGTMNLLYHRLHGDRTIEETVGLVAAGRGVRTRPGVIRCGAGLAFAEVLAGPGTSWHEVREAMRDADLAGTAANAVRALGATLTEPGVSCAHPQPGHEGDYPMIRLTPRQSEIEVSGFRAETAGEFLEESLAVLRRRFREGPHDDLCTAREVRLASASGEPFPILIDGEPAECPAEANFRLVPCPVNLLATDGDGR